MSERRTLRTRVVHFYMPFEDWSIEITDGIRVGTWGSIVLGGEVGTTYQKGSLEAVE